jgi:hypothetical protein
VIHFACPNCQTAFNALPSTAGMRAKCPQCGNLMEVPVPKGVLLPDSAPAPSVSASLLPTLPDAIPPASAPSMAQPASGLPKPVGQTQANSGPSGSFLIVTGSCILILLIILIMSPGSAFWIVFFTLVVLCAFFIPIAVVSQMKNCSFNESAAVVMSYYKGGHAQLRGLFGEKVSECPQGTPVNVVHTFRRDQYGNIIGTSEDGC